MSPEWMGGWGISFSQVKLEGAAPCMRACSIAQSCQTLGDPMDCSPPGSSVHGIFQARILEWVAIYFSRGSSPHRDQTQVSCIGRWIPYHCATWEARCYFIVLFFIKNIYKGIFTTDLYMRLQLILFYLMAIITTEIDQQWKWSLHEVLSFLTWIDLVKINNYF